MLKSLMLRFGTKAMLNRVEYIRDELVQRMEQILNQGNQWQPMVYEGDSRQHLQNILEYLSNYTFNDVNDVLQVADSFVEEGIRGTRQDGAFRHLRDRLTAIRRMIPNLELDTYSAPVVAIAQNIAQNNDWELCPILADALEEAGCTDDSLLKQLRNHWYQENVQRKVRLIAG